MREALATCSVLGGDMSFNSSDYISMTLLIETAVIDGLKFFIVLASSRLAIELVGDAII